MSNVGELDRVRRFLRDHPDLHDQTEWACGTTACVAGWTVALAAGVQAGADVEDHVGFPYRLPARKAGDILGLTADESRSLFKSTVWRDPDHTVPLTTAEANEQALLLMDALIARDKGEACDADRQVLTRYGLPTEPAPDTP